MRHRSILFLLVLLCCVAVPALAASDLAPAFVRTVVTAPLEGREPLRVIFEPDEAACRKAYGDDWSVRCAAAPGQDGAAVSGVRLSPDIPGEWRWSGGDTMEFRPKNPWPESTAYTLSLAKLPLPSRMKLASPSLSFSTPPLAVLEMDGRLWIDPDLNGERAVSFDVRFTTPPDRQTVQRDAALKVSDKSLMLAKPEFVWGENGTCLIKSRILSLAKTPATVTLSLPGVAAEVRRDGTHWKIPKGKMEARQQVTAPGISSLFRIKSASFETSRDASLAGEYRLTVETSLLVRPDAFAKAVTALRLPRALEEGAVGASVRIGQHAAGSGREDEFRFRSVEQALQGIRGVPVAESEHLQRLVPRQTASERIALHDAEPVFMPGHVDRRHSFFVDPYPAPCGEVFVASAVQNGDQVVPCGIAVTVVGQILADAVAEFFRPQFGEKHLHDHRGFAVNDLAVQQSRIGKVR